MTNVITIPAMGDNFIYLHPCGEGRAFAVDPGDASRVLEALARHKRTLTAILLTHHHWDHTGGVADLRAKTGCQVVGVDRSLIPPADQIASDGDGLTIDEVRVRFIGTPGHTKRAISFHVEPSAVDPYGVVYTGDTLFIGGCGRLLEGDAETMWQSLQKLAALPGETRVYCGHDYTLENYEFATSVAPDHRPFRERLAQVQRALEYGEPTVPSTIAQELTANIFLCANEPAVRAAVGMPDAPAHEVFAELRRRKDIFG